MLWAPIIAASAGTVAALVSYLNHRRITEVHMLVNARLDTALERIAQLGDSLTSAGVAIPPKPSSEDTKL